MKNLSKPNQAAILKQAICREFPDAEVVEHDAEYTVFIGEPTSGVSVSITHVEVESKTLHEIVMGVVAVAANNGLKSASAIAEAKRTNS